MKISQDKLIFYSTNQSINLFHDNLTVALCRIVKTADGVEFYLQFYFDQGPTDRCVDSTKITSQDEGVCNISCIAILTLAPFGENIQLTFMEQLVTEQLIVLSTARNAVTDCL